MIRTELTKLEKMKYSDLCQYLIEKYGQVQGDYFLNETCRSVNNKIKRAHEGLFIHHIKESEYINLSNVEFAIIAPYEYQKADMLVYCDYIEHMLLHICIVKEFLSPNRAKKMCGMVGIGGLFIYMFPQIIDYINGYKYKQEYMQIAMRVIDGNEDFIAKTMLSFREYLDDFDNNKEKILLIDQEFGPGHDMFQGKMIKSGRFNTIMEEVCGISWSSAEEINKRILELHKQGAFDLSVGQYRSRNGIEKEYYLSYRINDELKQEDYFIQTAEEIEKINLFIENTFDKFRYGKYENCFVYIVDGSKIEIEENKKSKNKNKKYKILIGGNALYSEFTQKEAEMLVEQYYQTKKALG